LLFNGSGQLETGSKSEGLLHSEVGEENIVLHNIGTIAGKSLLVKRHLVVENNGTRDGSLVDHLNTIGQDVKEGSFSSTGGTHDVGSLTGRSETGGSLDDLLATVLHTSGGDLFFALSHFDLEADVVPGELDGVSAE
jgi:hypothetical protein